MPDPVADRFESGAPETQRIQPSGNGLRAVLTFPAISS
jgi:hypothetical protein